MSWIEAVVVVGNEPSEGTEKLGDVKLRHFSVIHNAKDQPLAVGIPDKGFYVLRKPQDLQLVLSADKKSKEEAVKDVENIAHLIDVSGTVDYNFSESRLLSIFCRFRSQYSRSREAIHPSNESERNRRRRSMADDAV